MIKKGTKKYFLLLSSLLVMAIIGIYDKFVIKQDYYVFTIEETVPEVSLLDLSPIINGDIFNQEGVYNIWKN